MAAADRDQIPAEGKVEQAAIENLSLNEFVKELEKGLSWEKLETLCQRIQPKPVLFTDRNKAHMKLRLVGRARAGDVIAVDIEFNKGKVESWKLGYRP
ncbi:hypothetical protein ACFSW8_03495 [Rubritalea tangerina]|uniref:Uncharacterized protein n=1 Tax=Rubritalea tangerina TaxID=430798 RepID=A0ABW4Z7R9_9BACT